MKEPSTFGKHLYLEVDEMLHALIPDPTQEEFDQLEANILLAQEIREPIDFWENKVIDGRTRLKIARKHNMAFYVRRHEFKNAEEAQIWMYRNQSGRRNMTPESLSIMRGALYAAIRRSRGDTIDDNRDGKNCPSTNSSGKTSAEAVAKECGVSERTVKNDVKFVEDVQKLAPEVAKDVVNGKVKATRAEVAELAKQTEAKQKAAVEKVKSGKAKRIRDVVSPKPKNGSVKGWDEKNDTKFGSMIGQLARMVDDRKDALGPSPHHQKILDALNSALVEFRAWKNAKRVA